MDHQQSNLIPSSNSPQSPQQPNQPQPIQPSQPKSPQQQPIDILVQLTQKNNPLPLLAVLDQVDLYTRTKDGVPIFNLLMNKFLPVSDLLQNSSIKFEVDLDGRTPLHYAVEVDDAKAVEWLLSKGAHNVADNFGNTPVMDAVRLGNRRSFLLCMHYQHVNEELPHIAAEYNRVWELRCMLALGLSLEAKNSKNKTPLEIAVENYSYEAVEYLASATENYQIMELKKLTDSAAIVRRVKRGYQKSSFLYRALIPLLQKLSQILLILLVTNLSPIFNTITGINHDTNILLSLYLLLQFLTFLLSILQSPPKKSPESIPKLLHEPYFPNNLDHICPSCFRRYQPEKEDHCDVCHCCVGKFHFHQWMCVNKGNQFLWVVGEVFWGYILWVVVRYTVQYYSSKQIIAQLPTQTQPLSFLQTHILSLYHITIPQQNPILALSLLIISMLLLKQILFYFQLIGMAFMNRTYQQVIRSQDYPHLYRVFRSKSGKLKTREERIFYRFKLCGGVFVGVWNMLRYFW